MPITAADLDDLLTVEEAAAFLKVSRPHFTEAALIESVNRKVVRAEPA
jgi:hypothetical protein